MKPNTHPCIHALHLWKDEGILGSTQYERLSILLVSSESEYVRRNTPKAITASTLVPEQEEEYWSDERVEQGLATKELFIAKLEVTKENPREAFVHLQQNNENAS